MRSTMRTARTWAPAGAILVTVLTAMWLTGCARTPAGVLPRTVREMTFSISFNGPINDDDFYFVPIDIAGGGVGPVPVFPGLVAGQGWVTGSATHYVQYHQRQYTVFQVNSLQPFQSTPIGVPIRSVLPQPGGQNLQFTIDLNALGVTSSTIDVNIITTNQPLSNVRLLDGLGIRGNDFLNIDITFSRTIRNSDRNVEGPDDVLNEDAIVQPTTDQTRPLDIVDWTISTTISTYGLFGLQTTDHGLQGIGK